MLPTVVFYVLASQVSIFIVADEDSDYLDYSENDYNENLAENAWRHLLKSIKLQTRLVEVIKRYKNGYQQRGIERIGKNATARIKRQSEIEWIKKLILLAIDKKQCLPDWHRCQNILSKSQINNLFTNFRKYSDGFKDALDEILKVRIVGTKQHRKVQSYIKETMENLAWDVEFDKFTNNTPFGNMNFNNIIATHNPGACKRLVLACHYDSKYTETRKFVGAVDSAVPCAMMISLAQRLVEKLNEAKNDDITLQFIFFDGEEAFKQWGPTDSLYGSQHLAKKWENTILEKSETKRCPMQHNTMIDRIELFVLLDLIGAPNPSFLSQFKNTQSLFKQLIDIQKQLNKLALFETSGGEEVNYFKTKEGNGEVQDDHLPFLRRNVPIVHLICTPFPSVWHTDADNADNLDEASINNILKVLQIFIVQYLSL
ncbi:glutaminyl-peptide cyclotransferase-like isoform X1 [Leptotrombidium deliense]|uniref:Glutaminyl-peptide cyclotransferase n=1 Tax=Leptotrombidium deliense TaxID=299467 RepID=A0A443SB91_9ACAR|nr:glutaminyl-peptide cyclotransferase-like isoform X1 [Leptotrombidium deliense]